MSNTSETMTWRTGVRATIPALISASLVWMFFEQIAHIDFSQVLKDIYKYSAVTWLTAGLFTWLSFAAISRYDPLIIRHLKFDVPHRRAASMGWKATAISQLAGFGLVTGTIVRWFELGLNPNRAAGEAGKQAFKITLSVTIAFLIAWGIVATLTFVWVQFGPHYVVAFICSVCVFYGIRRRSGKNASKDGTLNRSDTTALIVVFTFLDTVFAALVIFVFLPTDTAPFMTLYLAFLLSYAAGLVSGLPGGFGPFEICMITLLPNIDVAVLASAMVGFRIIYFAVPAVSAIALMGKNLPSLSSPVQPTFSSTDIPNNLKTTAPAEADLLRNSRLSCVSNMDQSDAALVQTSKHAIVQLGNRFGAFRYDTRVFDNLLKEAKWSKRSFCMYRCDKATARYARAKGLRSLRFSSEAMIDTTQFDLRLPASSGLRRKIRKAGRADMKINSQAVTMAELAEMDADWSRIHGSARGFSTGVFSTELISRQRVYTAFVDNSPVAFVTFSTTDTEWLLDLIRYRENCVDGATYALVAQAIEDARLCGVKSVSLGSVPFAPPVHTDGIVGSLFKQIFDRSSALSGLYQFKKSFSPIWQDRFYATSSPLGFCIGAWVIKNAIFTASDPAILSTDS